MNGLPEHPSALDRWVGLVGAMHVDARPGGFVVAPEVATEQLAAGGLEPTPGDPNGAGGGGVDPDGSGGVLPGDPTEPIQQGDATKYYGRFELDRVRAIRQLEELLANVLDQLARAPEAGLSMTLEINATSGGFTDQIRRIVTENANQLGAVSQEFE